MSAKEKFINYIIYRCIIF